MSIFIIKLTCTTEINIHIDSSVFTSIVHEVVLKTMALKCIGFISENNLTKIFVDISPKQKTHRTKYNGPE